MKQAECCRELKNYPAAQELYHEFELKYPNNGMLPRALLGEAWTLFEQGDLASARGIAQRVCTQFVGDPSAVLDAQFLVVHVLTNEKKYDARPSTSAGKLPPTPTTPRASEGFFWTGEALYEARRWANAITCYKRVQSRTTLLEHLHRQIDELQTQSANDMERGAVPTYERQLSDLRRLLAKCDDGPNLAHWPCSALRAVTRPWGVPKKHPPHSKGFLRSTRTTNSRSKPVSGSSGNWSDSTDSTMSRVP